MCRGIGGVMVGGRSQKLNHDVRWFSHRQRQLLMLLGTTAISYHNYDVSGCLRAP